MALREGMDSAYDVLTSKTTRRSILYAVVLTTGSAVLYGLAVFAYVLFYQNYLPDQVRSMPAHLQYGYTENPFAMVDLRGARLMGLQEYDIAVSLTVPRSPANLDRGNFMVELYLLDGGGIPPQPPEPAQFIQSRNMLFVTARAAVVPYTDPLVALASRLLFMAYHIFLPFSERTTLVVPMAEGLSFPRNGPLPSALVLLVNAGPALQTYSAAVTIVARLRGLRWFMYNWRVTAFVLFTTLYWAVGVLSMAAAFLAFGGRGKGAAVKKAPAIKQEGDESSELSDTEKPPPKIKEEGEGSRPLRRALPPAPGSNGAQLPTRGSPRQPAIKQEEAEGSAATSQRASPPVLGADSGEALRGAGLDDSGGADDDDDDAVHGGGGQAQDDGGDQGAERPSPDAHGSTRDHDSGLDATLRRRSSQRLLVDL